METFTLHFDEDNKVFYGKFKGISRDFFTRLKQSGYIEKVIVELFPETLSGEIIIDIFPENDLKYEVDFYFDTIATKEMKQAINKWKNRDIDINEDDETLEVHIKIEKASSEIQLSEDKKNMIITL